MIKLCLHPMELTCKPPRYVTANISDEIVNHQVELDITQLGEALGKGQTWCPGIFDGERLQENFISQQVIVGDVDSGDKSKETLLEELSFADLTPNILHESFSSKPDNKKWRLVFLLSEPLELTTEVKGLTKWIASLVDGDTCVADSARLLFGTDKKVEVLTTEPIDVDWALNKANSSIYSNEESSIDYSYLTDQQLPEDFKELNRRIVNLTKGDRSLFFLMVQDVKDWLGDPTIKGSGYETVLGAAIKLGSISFMPQWGVEEILLKEIEKHEHFTSSWRHYNRKEKIIEKGYAWARANCEMRL